MVMSIAIIYIFLSYVMFDQQLKITSTKSSGSPEKIHYPLFTYSPLKIQKVQVPPFLPTLKNFQPPPLQKVGEDTMVEAIWGKLQLNWKDIFNLFTASEVSCNSDYLCNTEQNRNWAKSCFSWRIGDNKNFQADIILVPELYRIALILMRLGFLRVVFFWPIFIFQEQLISYQ